MIQVISSERYERLMEMTEQSTNQTRDAIEIATLLVNKLQATQECYIDLLTVIKDNLQYLPSDAIKQALEITDRLMNNIKD